MSREVGIDTEWSEIYTKETFPVKRDSIFNTIPEYTCDMWV